MAFADTLRLTITWAIDAVPFAQNVLHYREVGGGSVNQDSAARAADAVIAAFSDAASIRASVADNVRINSVSLRDLRTDNLVEFVVDTSADPLAVGESLTDVLPLQNALVVTLRTGLAGGSFRGRTYLGGFTEGSNTGTGLASIALRDRCEAFVSGLLGPFTDWTTDLGTAQLAVLSRTRLQVNEVISHEVRDGIWDTQRRRADATLG